MNGFESSIVIHRPIEDVFAVLANLEHDADWRSEWVESKKTSEGPPVDALDEDAAAFYVAHGFMRLPESMRLVLPMHSLERLFAGGPGLSKRSR